MQAEKFFTEEQKVKIVSAIEEAELSTSGEIRVHLEKQCNEEVLDRATYWFKKLDMHKTEQRNGVLFYLAVDDKKFAIIGDAGINAVTADDFWDCVKEAVINQFKNGEFTQGLVNGILMAGKVLKKNFPYQTDDINELSNEISFGNKSEKK